MITAFIKGWLLSASLIIAIGSQNLFLLQQGLRQTHIVWVCSLCVLCDLVLMSLGIWGIGLPLSQSPIALNLLSIAGALFLSVYGLQALRRIVKNTYDVPASKPTTRALTRRNVILMTLGITLLNPHVYIDTVVVIGGISVALSAPEKAYFFIGAMTVSIIWFYGIGYGARYLIPLFMKSHAWKVLDGITAMIMSWLVYDLLTQRHWPL